MGDIACICLQDGNLTSLLSRLPKVKRRHYTRILPLSGMNECIKSLGYATVFSILGINCEYWQIEIDKRNREKIAFIFPYSPNRFTRMPLGLKSALITFQRAIDVILVCMRWQFVPVYLKDLKAFSRLPEDPMEQVRCVLRLLYVTDATLRPKQ